MASTPPNPSPGADFMEEFYAECDEHLVEIRRGLLRLEEQLGELSLDRDVLEKIFRSFHSVKGICGMAGLQEAEKLAHGAEDYLRALTRQDTALTEEGLDILNLVTQKLEELVVHQRQGRPPPDITALLEQVAGLSAGAADDAEVPPATTHYPAQVVHQIGAARQQGKELWLCRFSPSPQLDQRGINLNSARAQLQSLGEVLHGAPRIEKGAELVFEFVLATESRPDPQTPWQVEGVDFKPFGSLDDSQPPPANGHPGAGTGTGASAFVAPSHFVRVDLGRLDDLMHIMGEMVVHRARLDEALGRVSDRLPSAESRKLHEITHGFSRDLRHLRDGLMRVRMVPIGEIFERLPFVVRDLSRESRKKIRLNIKGQSTELDKYLVERLKDPLLHLVRNAVCHGIEEAEERVAKGKPAEGTITLRASTAGESVVIDVADDGRGIDAAEVAVRARASGLHVSDDLNASELLELLCAPGLSTRDEADLGAGRGIGMAAVKGAVLDLGGEMELDSGFDQGTTFRLRLPLTLAVADALIISAGGQRFALPQGTVQEITTATEASINRLERNEIVKYRNGVLPLVRLASIFGLGAEPRKEFPVLVIGTGLNAVGILADRVLGQREIVVRPVNDPLLKVPGISGATELGDGRAVLILDSASLAQGARARQRQAHAR
jgi:two-component system, chemotaxis family, sensor kinase CheA